MFFLFFYFWLICFFFIICFKVIKILTIKKKIRPHLLYLNYFFLHAVGQHSFPVFPLMWFCQKKLLFFFPEKQYRSISCSSPLCYHPPPPLPPLDPVSFSFIPFYNLSCILFLLFVFYVDPPILQPIWTSPKVKKNPKCLKLQTSCKKEARSFIMVRSDQRCDTQPCPMRVLLISMFNQFL